MRITIVNGFFLPVPPVVGGATEKSWNALAREFAARGHQVVSISRRWQNLRHDEFVDGVRHLRLPGADHRSSLARNLIQDFLWSGRAYRNLPAADIVVCNALILPVWLGRCKPAAGRVVVMCGRMPKGQYRRYSHLGRVLAPSSFVRDRVVAENPRLADCIRVTGYPIDWTALSSNSPGVKKPTELVIGYVGRLHEEKGLLLLADALQLLAKTPGLPSWKIVLCGPSEVRQGGSGIEFRQRLLERLTRAIPDGRVQLLEPEFNEQKLTALYQAMDLFCYPSLAEKGETFGVAVAEAMAAGAVPVVSGLTCFRDLVHDDVDGAIFDHTSPNPARSLAEALAGVLRDADRRARLAQAARAEVRRLDFPAFAEMLLADFATLARS